MKEKNILTGRSSGAVGARVFLTIKRFNVSRKKPLEVFNPRSPAQVLMRSRYSHTLNLFQILKPILAIGFKNLKIKKSLINVFQTLNMPQLFVIDALHGQSIDYRNLKIASGGYDYPVLAVARWDALLPKKIGYKISNVFDGYKELDELYFLVYNQTQDVFFFNLVGYPRTGGTKSFNTSINTQNGDVVHIYAFLVSHATGNISQNSHNFLSY